jgi:hypothetical protein
MNEAVADTGDVGSSPVPTQRPGECDWMLIFQSDMEPSNSPWPDIWTLPDGMPIVPDCVIYVFAHYRYLRYLLRNALSMMNTRAVPMPPGGAPGRVALLASCAAACPGRPNCATATFRKHKTRPRIPPMSPSRTRARNQVPAPRRTPALTAKRSGPGPAAEPERGTFAEAANCIYSSNDCLCAQGKRPRGASIGDRPSRRRPGAGHPLPGSTATSTRAARGSGSTVRCIGVASVRASRLQFAANLIPRGGGLSLEVEHLQRTKKVVVELGSCRIKTMRCCPDPKFSLLTKVCPRLGGLTGAVEFSSLW